MATWLSLGSAADVDPSEGSYNSENASDILGTYSSAVLSTVEAVGNDGNRDGVISDNDQGANSDTVSIDGTPMSLDSTIKFSATITRGDGTTYSTDVGVIQMTNGEVYLLPLNETELDFMNIQTVELTSVVNANYTGASVSTIGRSIDDTQIVCFTKGTPIATIQGQVDVSDLKIGDKVMTMDNGYQPICWVGKKRVQAKGHLAPVTIARGALGPNIPEHNLCVSQQHRILMRSKIAIRMFDTSEILVPAKKLVGQAGISIEDHRGVVEYVHFLLPQHEIVFAAGAPAESLYFGQEMLGTVGDDARKEIFSLFPELMHPAFQPQSARQFAPGSTIPGRALTNMLRRIKGNQKALVERMSLSAL